MPGFCSCNAFGDHFASECTEYTKHAREAELNSGRQEKLPFAQLIIKPTIADNYVPKTASGAMAMYGQPAPMSEIEHYDSKYGVYVPAGGKIKVEPCAGFEGWVYITVYDKAGIIQSIRVRPEAENTGVPEKYADTDPDKLFVF
jgi:hypothetical protein